MLPSFLTIRVALAATALYLFIKSGGTNISWALQALASNNLERVASTMDQFERQFENLDVQSQFVEGAMNNQASLSTPEEDVNMLLQQARHLKPSQDLLLVIKPEAALADPSHHKLSFTVFMSALSLGFKLHVDRVECREVYHQVAEAWTAAGGG